MKVFNWLIGLVAVIITLFLLDIFLHTFKPFYFSDNYGVYTYDPDLEIVPKKNVYIVRSKDYLEEYVTNSLGTINFQNNFSQYKYLVFVIGDSHTQGIGLSPDTSYPFQLDLMLNMQHNEYKPIYGVVNLGLAGYGSRQELIMLQRFIEIIGKPHFILLQGCRNDYDNDLRFARFQRGKSSIIVEGHPKIGWFIKPLSWFAYETEIGKRLYWVIKTYWMKTSSESSDSSAPVKICTAERIAPIYQEIDKVASEINAKLIVTWANLDDSYDWLKNWTQEKSITFCDWRPAAMSVSKQFPNLSLTNPHSGNHYRTWVAKIIAANFTRHIQNHLMELPLRKQRNELLLLKN